MRELDEGKVVAFYNKLHDVNRFFVQQEAGDGQEASNIDDDLFDNELEDELSVFKNKQGDEKDLVEQNENEILFFVDLDNESIVEKQDRQANEWDADHEEEIKTNTHPILIN